MQLLIDKYLFWSTKQLVKLTYFFLYSKITVQTFPLPKLSLLYHAKLISKKWMNGLNEKLFLSLFLFMWLVFTQITDKIWKEDLARSLLNSTYRVQCYTKLFWNGKAISTRMFGILIFFTHCIHSADLFPLIRSCSSRLFLHLFLMILSSFFQLFNVVHSISVF